MPAALNVLRGAGRGLLRAAGGSEQATRYVSRIYDILGAQRVAGPPIEGSLPDGSRVLCDLSDYIQRQMWFWGAFDLSEAFVYSRLARPGMVVVDGGANVGQYTLLGSTAVGPSGAVHSFEPVPQNWRRLRHHVDMNGCANVHLNQLGLWSSSRNMLVGMPPGIKGNAGAFSVRGGAEPSGLEISVVALDEYLAQTKVARVDFLKLDVEGAEPWVIEGAMGTLERDRPLIFMEVNRTALDDLGASTTNLWDTLAGLGYRAWAIGNSAATSRVLTSFDEIRLENIVLHQGALPDVVTHGWTHADAQSWGRSGRI
jgi:FkbM family methyltransferase